jgi:CRISPR-associated protein Csm5
MCDSALFERGGIMNRDNLRTWEITLLTPLHIGDGETMLQGMDYIPAKDGLQVIHIDRILESVADNPKAVNDLCRMKIGEFIRSYKLHITPEYTLKAAQDVIPGEIRRFIKSAHCAPYLPGSSLKGSIRTALWATLNRKGLPSPAAIEPFKKKTRQLAGEPHSDFLRPLAVSDSIEVFPPVAMTAQEIKFFNLQTGNKPGWKDFSSKRTLPEFKDATGVFVEAVPPEKQFYVRAMLDMNFLKEPFSKLWPIPKGKGLEGFPGLAQTINDHSRETAKRELEFFKQYGAATSGVVKFYEELLTAFKEIDKMAEAFILRLGWGIGWRGMTGDWLRDSDLAEVRKTIKPKLGKPGVDIFPKTRRLGMEDGFPKKPLGWVFIKPVADHFFLPKRNVAIKENLNAQTMGGSDTENFPPSQKDLEPKEIARKVQTETWKEVLLIWTRNDGRIAAQYRGNKAETKNKALVPASLDSSLFGTKKRAIAKTLEVEPIGGNNFRIVKIEG